jgi:twinkle protein
MLKEGRGREVIDAIWGAKIYRPDGVVGIKEVIAEALKPEEPGVSWPWPALTDLTHGIKTREIHTLGAGVGSGKTDVFTQIIAHCITTLKEKVGVIYLEQNPSETLKRIGGKVAGKPFHVPGKTDPASLEATLRSIEADDRLLFYNHFGSMDWDTIKSIIRFMVAGCGCKRIFLDHLTALVAHEEDERRALDAIMAEEGALVHELDFTLFQISHLATPDGKPHEEGGRIMARHFRGSRAIMQWSMFMYGLERDQQAADEELRQTSTFRILKDRKTGQSTGKTFPLRYNPETGLLEDQTAINPF